MTTFTSQTDIDWPAPDAIAAERVITGAPVASTVTTATTPNAETGLWRVTEGEFTTHHEGYIEFIHILEGDGELVHDDGSVIPLRPGITATMDDGWKGRWVVRAPIVKAYAILSTQ